MAKSRLAPLKTMTIPRLELAAAALAVNVDGALQRELDLKLEKSVFWTDSTIVLCYINNASKHFQTYVANRVAVIHGGSTTDQWRHVSSDLNPADDVTRGLSADDIVQNRRWISGLSFLHDDESKWPASQSVDDMSGDDLEVKKPIHLAAEVYLVEADATEPATDTLIEGYSSWYRLKRGVAMMLRVKRWLLSRVRKLPTNDIRSVLCADELRTAEREIIRYVQGRTFKREITEAIENGLETTKLRSSRISSLYSLRRFLSDNGLLCVGGRLRKANVPDRQKHPLILPKRHHVMELIIKERHVMSGHTGREHVLSLVRQCYWIVAGRQAVRRLLKSCFACKRRHAPPATQKMADLPSCRLQSDHPPFTFVGVDLVGPMLVKLGRSEVKRCRCIFTCLTVRAVHLEMTNGLDTDSFINALQRFTSRRGAPKEIWCDNGTNFVGAERELRRSLKEWNRARIHDFLLQRDIEWHFNPPRASHMGGVWERMIRSVRMLLNPLLKEKRINDEGMLTLLCSVEAIINGRPLTAVSDDPNDLSALTPNDLLIPGTPRQLPLGLFRQEDQYVRRRWRQVQYLADVFWRRWTKEYLPTLQARSKWSERKPNISVGDIVLLVDDTHRNYWPRVLEVFPGDDGLVRTVKVKTQSTTLVRPIAKICLLETAE